MRFCGIDLHSNNSMVVITDETDRILVSKRCKNELSAILALLEPHRGQLAGVVVNRPTAGTAWWMVFRPMVRGEAR